MDIRLLKQYLANKSPRLLRTTKKPSPSSPSLITEAPSPMKYSVVRSEVIPKSEVVTGLVSKTPKVVTNPNGGKHAVLLKFSDGHYSTGLGKTEKEAIEVAIASKIHLFGE